MSVVELKQLVLERVQTMTDTVHDDSPASFTTHDVMEWYDFLVNTSHCVQQYAQVYDILIRLVPRIDQKRFLLLEWYSAYPTCLNIVPYWKQVLPHVAVPKSLRLSKIRIHTIGDSHSKFGWEAIRHETLEIVPHWIGPKLMHSVPKLDLASQIAPADHDWIVHCFGEIDVRCHVHKHVKDGKYKSVIDDLVKDYVASILESIHTYAAKGLNIYPAIFNVLPTIQVGDPVKHNPDYPHLGTDDERRQYTEYMNAKLNEACIENNILFINVYDAYVKDGVLNTALSDGIVHIRDISFLRECVVTNLVEFKSPAIRPLTIQREPVTCESPNTRESLTESLAAQGVKEIKQDDMTCVTETYKNWNEAATDIAMNRIDQQWKSDPKLTYMLEHVSVPQATRYLERIVSQGVQGKDIQRMCGANDCCGGATLISYTIGTETIQVTGASLRYLFHALWIVDEIDDLTSIVEIGGGYGGLALMLPLVAKWKNKTIASYRIYDLPGPCKLQKAYLRDVGKLDQSISLQSTIYSWGDASTFGTDTRDKYSLLVSTYAVSELDHELCDRYLESLVPRCTRVFFTWNTPYRSRFLPKCKEIKEDPLTGPHNVIMFN